ncbi:MAG: hypothetical protein M3N24_11075 [Actinomycetota bacterium]|nr:hypothetical protein [Actinomycetota bacterium]
MAIYRPQRSRWKPAAIAGIAGLIVGLLVGWGILRSEPEPAEVIRQVRASLSSAAATLEVVEVEYAESVRDGRIVATPEFQGARAALTSSRERYLEAREAVATVAPNAASAIDAAYQELQRLVERRAPRNDVSDLADDLRRMLNEALAGGDGTTRP